MSNQDESRSVTPTTKARPRYNAAVLLGNVLSPLGVVKLESPDKDLRPGQWIDSLYAEIEEAGYEFATTNLSIRELPVMPGTGQKLLTHVKSDAGDPIFVWILGSNRGKYKTLTVDQVGSHPKSLNSKELMKLLKVDSLREPRRWYVLNHLRPLDSLRSVEPARLPPTTRLLRLLRLEQRSLRIILAYALAVGILTLATPLAVQTLVNTVAFGSLLQPLVVLTLLLFAGLFLAGSLHLLEIVVIEYWQRRFFTQAAADISHRLPQVSHTYLEKHHLPEVTNRFLDVAALQKTVSALLLDGVGLALQTTVGLLVLAFYHPLLLAFDVVLIFALFLIFRVGGKGAVDTACMESKAKYKVVAWLQAMARSAATAPNSEQGAMMRVRADALTDNYLRARESHFAKVIRQTAFLVLLQAVASAILLGTGGYLVIKGQLSLGQLVAAELIVTAVIGNVAKFGKHLEAFYDASASMSKVGQLLDLPLRSGRSKCDVPNGCRIVASELSACTLEGKPLFKEVTFDWGLDEIITLSGPAGSGKSLLLSILAGRAEPSEGAVSLGHTDALLGPTRASGAFHWLSLELFPGTIQENLLAAGGLDASPERLEELLVAIGAAQALSQLHDGLATEISGVVATLPMSLRVQLAVVMGIASGARTLLMDGLLDLLSRSDRLKVIEVLRGNGIGAIITTHFPNEGGAGTESDRHITLEDLALVEAHQ